MPKRAAGSGKERDDDWAPLELHYHGNSDSGKAMLVSENGDRKKGKWVPLSQCKDVAVSPDEKSVSFELKKWLAEKEGLI